MMDEDERQSIEERAKETASVASANPEERAFSGHPDHPPSAPDQPLEGNQELLRHPGEREEASTSEAEAQPS
jgi:hypothetical protein